VIVVISRCFYPWASMLTVQRHRYNNHFSVMWSETVGLRTRLVWDQKNRSWSWKLWSWSCTLQFWSCSSGVVLWNAIL